MKKSVIISLVVAFIFAMSVASFAEGTWVFEGVNKKYQEDGQFVVSDWKHIKIDDTHYSYYYFDANGNMVTGLQKIGDEVYSFNNDGTTNTNGKIIIDGEEYETKNKGKVEGLASDFDIDAWRVRHQAEILAEKKSIADNKAFKAQFDASVAESESIKAAALAAANAEAQKAAEETRAAVEAKRLEDSKNTIRMAKYWPDAITVETYEKGKITVKYLYPELTGGKAAEINAVLKSKVNQMMGKRFKNEYDDYKYKKTIQFRDVSVRHDLTKNQLTINFYNSNESADVKFYVNVDTLEFIDSGDLKE